ncbi:YheC/YheD family protein [Paenibacillus sp. NFR01]|uniref:YheC/YheD family protein n=1 Tax=Paenibacillus sp. NFR01 TaxID=1566279 RepID=UPI0008CF3E22|nr:YheC/YheD family protein [Paenibacillus sp. NFR01]SEU18846.1 YheC/D like ATP-grasp [Paenibacillus sp. NFR01]
MGQLLVGILLNAAMHRGVPRLDTGQESLANYEEAAAAYGLVPCFLQLSEMDMESGFSYAYMRSAEKYRKVVVPTPAVIHNRAIYGPEHRGVERLVGSGLRVFNRCNRYGKDQIHRLLTQNEELRRFLPETRTGYAGLLEMMESCPDLILKPCRGSVGKGIMRLQRASGGRRFRWSFKEARSGRWRMAEIDAARPPRILRQRLAVVPYLVQERIPLAEVDGRPFDLRVTVQRGWGGEWQVTGMFAKAAPRGSFVSNIGSGGEALGASEALERAFGGAEAARLRMAAQALCLQVAKELEKSLPGLADIGLDIGVTGDRQLYFIECNGRDQRYGFRKAGMEETWKDSYRRPMAYARYLLDHAPKSQLY